MTSKDLFNEMNLIDDDLIEEAGDYMNMRDKSNVKKFFTKSNTLKFAGIAAAVCLIVCAGWGISNVDFSGGQIETGKHIYVANETVSNGIEMAIQNETGMLLSTNEMVCFGGCMYRTYSTEAAVTDQTIEETILNKGELLGKVEDSSKYGESIYKGCSIYRIDGRKGTKQILVEHNNELLLFHLYEWLCEPNMTELFNVYGIELAEDIQNVTVKYGPRDEYGWHINSNIIDEPEKINEIYNILFSLTLDKNGYDKILDEISKADLKAWKDAGGAEVQTAEDGVVVSAPPYRGTTAFDGSVDIVILSGDNEEITYSYYPKMGYLKQYKATEELIAWITTNTK